MKERKQTDKKSLSPLCILLSSVRVEAAEVEAAEVEAAEVETAEVERQ